MEYFSEREGETVSRQDLEISKRARRGICALIRAGVEDGSFGASFRRNCDDEPVAIGTDEDGFWDALAANVPSSSYWPRNCEYGGPGSTGAPTTFQVLDIIEFCWRHIAEPIEGRDHSYFGHVHLTFDRYAGQQSFREAVEDIFRRNGVAYTLTESGRIERLLPPELDPAASKSEFHSDDADLNHLLDTARSRFLDPEPQVRREALESLWDAWERLMTLWPGSHKGIQAQAMLSDVAGPDSPTFLEALDKEAKELTVLGNKLQVRHFGTDQEKLAASEHVDYLFMRMFSLIWMILRTQRMVGVET